jgi:hypothetical protein
VQADKPEIETEESSSKLEIFVRFYLLYTQALLIEAFQGLSRVKALEIAKLETGKLLDLTNGNRVGLVGSERELFQGL